jgi:hypothetical protein
MREARCRTCGRLFILAPEHAMIDSRGAYCKPTCWLHRPPQTKGKGRTAKKVEQCTLDGELIAVFDSSYQADIETGLLKSGIERAIKSGNAYHGFIWRHAKESADNG